MYFIETAFSDCREGLLQIVIYSCAMIDDQACGKEVCEITQFQFNGLKIISYNILYRHILWWAGQLEALSLNGGRYH